VALLVALAIGSAGLLVLGVRNGVTDLVVAGVGLLLLVALAAVLRPRQ